MRKIRVISSFAVLILVILAILNCSPGKPVGNLNTDTLPGMQTGPAPWPAEITNLKERLKDINLPALSEEGAVLHTHQHLDIFVDGKPIQVPHGIGMGENSSFLAPIHTHDTRGIIHIESPTDEVYTLGQFFDIWGVRLTANCIGGYCNQGEKTLKVFINGNPFSGDPRTIKLEQHQEIFVSYGTADEIPSEIPSSYEFPEGF
ncbi:MAG: hypothetical protein ABSA18_00410 [Dehalococcoidia bacterium]|jgi:hypothetical protein